MPVVNMKKHSVLICLSEEEALLLRDYMRVFRVADDQKLKDLKNHLWDQLDCLNSDFSDMKKEKAE